MRLLLVVLLALLATPGAAGAAEGRGAFAFSFTSIEGEPLPLSRFAGRPLLVVNTASRCGYTYQYAHLQRLWETYRSRGLVLLGVPSNDFGGQEPGSNAEIKTFCEVNFDVDFPLAEKVRVRGEGSHPLFAWFRERLGEAAGPHWNFHKYLVAPDGRLVASWPSRVEPDDPRVVSAIEEILAATGS